MIAETQVGIQNLANFSRPILRSTRSGAVSVVEGHARFTEAVIQGNVYSFSVGIPTLSNISGIGTGQVVGGSANPSLNFALWNPVGSGKNLVLWRFNMAVSSGTPASGAVWHGMMNTSNVIPTSTVLSTTFGSVNMNGTSTTRVPTNGLPISGAGGVANTWFHTSGAALTGASAPWQLYMANFAMYAVSQVSTPFAIQTSEWIDGKIVIQPGYGWCPLHTGVGGVAVIHSYSVIWEEVLI